LASSELLIHHLNQFCRWFILGTGNKPLPEVALDCDMQHFFLVMRQLCVFNFTLDLCELALPQFHHPSEF